MAKPYQLSKKELDLLNQGLADCHAIKEDLERAKLAGVPNVEHIQQSVDKCEERINQLKAIYASNRK